MGQVLHMRFLKVAGGVLATVVVVLLAVVRIAFEIIGASTAPDDFGQLQERMPKVLAWFFTTPWIVPTLLLFALAALAAWLLVTGLRSVAVALDESAPAALSREDIIEIVQAHQYQPTQAGDPYDAELGRKINQWLIGGRASGWPTDPISKESPAYAFLEGRLLFVAKESVERVDRAQKALDARMEAYESNWREYVEAVRKPMHTDDTGPYSRRLNITETMLDTTARGFASVLGPAGLEWPKIDFQPEEIPLPLPDGIPDQ